MQHLQQLPSNFLFSEMGTMWFTNITGPPEDDLNGTQQSRSSVSAQSKNSQKPASLKDHVHPAQDGHNEDYHVLNGMVS